jgi:methionyl aminopeptidase
VLANHGGHGIGRTMHEDPHVPNEGGGCHQTLLWVGVEVSVFI